MNDQTTQEQAREWTGPFHFVAIADPQLGILHNNQSWDEYVHKIKERNKEETKGRRRRNKEESKRRR